MTDERYGIHRGGNRKNPFLPSSLLSTRSSSAFSPKKKRRRSLSSAKSRNKYRPETDYTEKQVNAVLADIYDDYVTIRRYLIEYGFMDRTRDGRPLLAALNFLLAYDPAIRILLKLL